MFTVPRVPGIIKSHFLNNTLSFKTINIKIPLDHLIFISAFLDSAKAQRVMASASKGKGVIKSSGSKTGGKLAPDINPLAMPTGDIKTGALFAEAFGSHGYTINTKKKLVLEEWNTAVGREKIRQWLISLGGRFSPLIDAVYRGSEYALYPLLVDTLGPVLALGSCQVDPLHADDPLPSEVMTEMANEMAAQSRQNSLTSRTEAETKESEDEIPTIFDTTDAENIYKFMVKMEASIRSANNKMQNKGRVEIMLYESDAGELGDPLAALEAKKHVGMQGVEREGFSSCVHTLPSPASSTVYTRLTRLGNS